MALCRRGDPARPEHWSILSSTESLAGWQSRTGQDRERLHAVVANALHAGAGSMVRALREEAWHPHSSRASTLYRRIEALFGGEPRPLRSLVDQYELPERIAGGSGAPLVAAATALPEADREFVAAVTGDILPAFARADGISSRLSDGYRSGMVANFILSALAVIVGVRLRLRLRQRRFANISTILTAASRSRLCTCLSPCRTRLSSSSCA